jgi:hypothetical protein
MATAPPSLLLRSRGTIPRKVWKDGKIVASLEPSHLAKSPSILQEPFQLKLNGLSRKPIDFKGVARTNLRLITLSGGENSASPAAATVSIGPLVSWACPGQHLDQKMPRRNLIREISSEVV